MTKIIKKEGMLARQYRRANMPEEIGFRRVN